jgi:xanthine dehydrogenase accessory factor
MASTGTEAARGLGCFGDAAVAEAIGAYEAARRPYAVVTVVRVVRPSSARAGMKAVVGSDGRLTGWIGGQCTRTLVADVAREAIRTGEAVLVRITPDPSGPAEPGVVIRPMTCHSGGTVDLFVEPRNPAPRLVVVGDTPVARRVADLGRWMGYDVRVVAPDADLGGTALEGQLVETAQDDAWVVVASQGAYDEETLLALAPCPVRYVGLVASRRRAEQLAAYLRERGAEGILDRLAAPAGLDLGARTAEEIAVSILADLTRRWRGRSEAQPPPNAPEGSVDPVCGMVVDAATALYRAEWDGNVYAFCCRGCWEHFQANPPAYVGR